MGQPYNPGDAVRIRADDHPGHHRTPLYLKGKRGVIEEPMGDHRNPETMAYGQDGTPRERLYKVRFEQTALWDAYGGAQCDTLVADIFEHWLEPIE